MLRSGLQPRRCRLGARGEKSCAQYSSAFLPPRLGRARGRKVMPRPAIRENIDLGFTSARRMPISAAPGATRDATRILDWNTAMEYRRLGASGFTVPALSFGTGTFGGKGAFFSEWGNTDVTEARRLVDICVEAGVTMFDSADIYSAGAAEEILGAAIKHLPREQVIISTKATFRSGGGPNEVGSSRYHLIQAVEHALRRLGTDYIDLFQLHGFDALTPVQEVLSTLDHLVRAGKIRYIGVSNFSGWHLAKSLAVSERYGYARYVANQTYYSLIGRDYEWELMPLGLDQGVGAVVWSPLGWGRLTGKIRRGAALPQTSRLHKTAEGGPQPAEDYLYRVIDALEAVSGETGKTVPQIALNWLLRRPTVATVVIGARNEAQLRQNLGAVGWELTPAQVKFLDAASEVAKPYPYWHQAQFGERNPPPV
jgi:aryl-alcohol dehydrogenase-like predicted oxidoreductase